MTGFSRATRLTRSQFFYCVLLYNSITCTNFAQSR